MRTKTGRGLMMCWLFIAFFALAGSGCEATTIKFHNLVPNATVANARWEPDDSETTISYRSLDVLEPGRISSTITIFESDAGLTGTVYFELVVEGNRIALVANDKVTAVSEADTIFEITPELPVHNPLLLLE